MRAKIIAEIGINHQGSYEIAERLISSALDAGADFVKFQMRDPRTCVPRDQWDKPKLTPWGKTMSYIEYREKMEFSDRQIAGLSRYSEGKLFPSVFDIISLERASRMGFPIIKIPSAMLTNRPLIEAAADLSGTKVMISTGMSTRAEIITNVKHLTYGRAGKSTIIMHCNSSYPTADDEVNLRALLTLRSLFPDCEIGFSSHSRSPHPAIYSMLFGAEWVEVHYTLDRTMIGSDHAASLEQPGLALLARERDKIPALLGDGLLRVYDSEKSARKKLRGT